MITMRERGERVRRRYPATIPKMGRGTLYITTHRVVFEAEKHGVCLDLHFRWLYEWYPTAKRKVQLSWHEPDAKTGDVRIEDETFGTEVVLERRQDKWKPDSIEFHYSLCFAYTEWTDDDMLRCGWYFGRDGKVRNHYRLAGPKQKTVDQYDGGNGNTPPHYQRVFHASDTRKEIAKYAKRCSGERLFDQELKWRGWDKYEDGDNRLYPRKAWPESHTWPYEPEYDRLKDYYPVPRVPTHEEMERMWRVEENLRGVLDSRKRIKDGLKTKSYKNSREHRRETVYLKGALAAHCYGEKLALKLAGMKFETWKQWRTVVTGAENAFRESKIEFSPDFHAIADYEPVIIDTPPAEPYRNEELEDMQKYRRLLVEAA